MPDQYADLEYPLGGVNLEAEVGVQLPLTSAVGQNVRASEPRENRLRGGSRPGLVRYGDDRLPLGVTAEPHVIQHLDYIVDPTDPALLINTESGLYGDPLGARYPGTTDPSTSNLRSRKPVGGRKVRPGGSGVQPHRKRPTYPSTGTATITFFAQGDGTYSISIEVVDGTDEGVYSNDDIPFEGSSSFPSLDSLPGGLVGTHPASYSHTGILLTGFSL